MVFFFFLRWIQNMKSLPVKNERYCFHLNCRIRSRWGMELSTWGTAAGVTHRPVCHQRTTRWWQRLAGHTWENCNPWRRHPPPRGQTASRCNPLEETSAGGWAERQTADDNGAELSHLLQFGLGHALPLSGWMIWKFLTEAWVTRPWKLSTYDWVCSFQLGDLFIRVTSLSVLLFAWRTSRVSSSYNQVKKFPF